MENNKLENEILLKILENSNIQTKSLLRIEKHANLLAFVSIIVALILSIFFLIFINISLRLDFLPRISEIFR